MTPGKKQAFEPTGLIPRSIVRTFERFYKQLLPRTKYSAIREYRISRYQVLVSIRCLCTLLILPLLTRIVANWLIFPQIQYFWDVTYQDEHVFSEIDQFSQVIFFDSLLDRGFLIDNENSDSSAHNKLYSNAGEKLMPVYFTNKHVDRKTNFLSSSFKYPRVIASSSSETKSSMVPSCAQIPLKSKDSINSEAISTYTRTCFLPQLQAMEDFNFFDPMVDCCAGKNGQNQITTELVPPAFQPFTLDNYFKENKAPKIKQKELPYLFQPFSHEDSIFNDLHFEQSLKKIITPSSNVIKNPYFIDMSSQQLEDCNKYARCALRSASTNHLEYKVENVNTKVAQDQALQEKIFELAQSSHSHALQSLTNVFADFLSIVVLVFLLITLKPEITILKSFLVEVIYNLSDTTKSFLLILMTDLLVGFHSPRGWETMFSLILYHFGLPENQDFVFLFVATLPVILDTVFKYWIFRHLNKISPSTVATYHNMIE